ncbi:hypothetical protein FXF51_09465 [Nonomuraea sp. PA05]|uniref:hypothetical protein n=1 Tax=Nonomuraea sp. PA05 TaxID=2604466 RepID=UPI0011D786A1|nr:hypothetical protein [Nonomuraea sp. PA05]TYB68747.1 hypothetical protein FXF51_09465 [Nonomuraea sp. PA05]
MHSARKNPRKLWARALAVLTALLMAALAGVTLAYPSLAATTCPGCYGLTELQPSLYTENNLSDTQKSQIKQTVTEARRRVSTFYGTQTSSPTLLICATQSCYERIGGGQERGIAVLNRAVMLSPKGIDPVIASHEMSHVELHNRLTSGHDVPQWFDEGLAVVVSDDARYLAPASSGDRCLTAPSGPLPVTLNEWLSSASKDATTYAKSACQVSRWLRDNGGRAALLSLVEHLNAGTPFATLVPSP